jgi:hypothetical protein
MSPNYRCNKSLSSVEQQRAVSEAHLLGIQNVAYFEQMYSEK